MKLNALETFDKTKMEKKGWLYTRLECTRSLLDIKMFFSIFFSTNIYTICDSIQIILHDRDIEWIAFTLIK